ncbi:MAG: RNA polymerase sigma factor [Ignavibacteriales bacterium]
MIALTSFVIVHRKERGGLVVYSEEQMIARARDGDVQAYTWIVETYKGLLLAAVMPIVGSEEAAEDVIQEAFLQIYRSLPQYAGGSFRRWAARIAVNKAIDWRRRIRRFVFEDEAPPLSETRAGRRTGIQPSAEEEALERMGLAGIASAVMSLTQVHRRAFLQHYVEGVSCAEMASMEGVSVKTIESRLYRARQILRKRLRESGGRNRP